MVTQLIIDTIGTKQVFGVTYRICVTTKGTDMSDEHKGPPWTMTVPEAGRHYYQVGRNASYRLAKSGVMPTIVVGGLIKALPRVIEAMLSKEDGGTHFGEES